MPDLPADAIALLERIAAAVEARDVLPEALDALQAATFAGVSRAKWHRMNADGHCPAPVELGDRCPRWLRSELMLWLRSGAPTRTTWRQMRESAMRRAG